MYRPVIIKNYKPVHWDEEAKSWEYDDRCVYCGDRENVTHGYHGQPECERCRVVRDRNGETLTTF